MTYFNNKLIELAERGTFLDIGANIGEFTLPMASKATTVYAFEPCAENVHMLNQRIIGYDNVVVIEAALSDYNGLQPMYMCDGPNHNARHTLSLDIAEYKNWGHNPDKFISVPCHQLDTYVGFNLIQNITAIKIDVEGAEDKVLAGAINTLENNNPLISIETHVPWDLGEEVARPFIEMQNRVERILKDCGYVFWTMDGICREHMSKELHYFCVKNHMKVSPF